MINIFERKQLTDGVYFSRLTDSRFKANRISVNFFTEFDRIPRADGALAAYTLAECCARYPEYSKLSAALLDLYDASIYATTSSFRDKRRTEVCGAALDDRYALFGEKTERELSQLMCECIFRPKAADGCFDEKITEMMRTELLDSIDSIINDKSLYAIHRAAKTVFAGEADELGPEGSREDALNATAASAYKAYREIIETARVEIFVSGCSDFRETERIFTEEFSEINRRCAVTSLAASPSALKSKPAVVRDRLEMQQAIVRMYFKAPELSDREANFLFSRILGGMTTSRFFENIREKQSLCYYCSSSVDYSKRVLTCYAGIEPETEERVRAAVIGEIRDIAENGVTEEELIRAKRELRNQLKSVYDSTSALIGWYVSQLAYGEFCSPEEFFERIEAVDAGRIRNVAQQYRLDTVYVLSGGGGDGGDD